MPERQKNGCFKKIEDILEFSRSGPYLLNVWCFRPTDLSPKVSENLRKSRDDSQVVGAVVGALAA